MEFSNFLVLEPLLPVHFIDKILPKLDNHLHLNFKKLWTFVQKGVSILQGFQNLFYCHPERSEGSQAIKNTRFFASLRMTIHAGRVSKSL